jgi:hypothetical protein
MAGDLIPPPSPAGKPEAEGLRRAPDEREPFSAVIDAPETAFRAEEEVRVVEPVSTLARHRSRFGFITGALAGTGVAALVVTILIVFGGGPSSVGTTDDDWSSWRPEATDTFGAAAQIGSHVAQRYRLNDGSQIVGIDAGPIAFRSEVLAQVVLRTAAVGGDIVPIDGRGLLYTFNGLGENGSIKLDKPSPERLAVLEKAALELALYTFRYVSDVDHLVVILPPLPPDATASASALPSGATGATGAATGTNSTGSRDPSRVLFFRPGDLRAQLESPLSATIPENPARPAQVTPAEVKAMSALMDPQFFEATFQQTPDGKVFLILERPKPVAAATATPTPTATAVPKPRKKKP